MRLTDRTREGEDGYQGDVRPHVAAEISGNQLEVGQTGIHCIYTTVNCVCASRAPYTTPLEAYHRRDIQLSDANFAQRLRDFRYEITKQNAKFESECCRGEQYVAMKSS